MKTTTKNQRVTRQKRAIPKKGSVRKSVENRDLNVDDQTTNGALEDEETEKKLNDVTLPSDRSVEDEEDREARRKSSDANPDDDIQN